MKQLTAGSRDSAVSEPPVTLPLGINPNQPIETLPNDKDSNSVGVEEILRFLGVETVRESGNLKVKTILKTVPPSVRMSKSAT
jgi:hypothetical protein